MLKAIVMAVFLGAAMSNSSALAQDRIETASEVSRSSSIKGFARDFYFSTLSIYDNSSSRYFQIYVTSAIKTTVSIAIGNVTDHPFPVNAMETLVFDVPIAWELSSSGEIQNKAIHVWSADADLSVSLLARNSAASDGMTIVPTSSWGKKYVVAAFASYAYLPGFELPSEFSIVANQDSTVVNIKPSTGLRQGTSTVIAYPQDQEFSIVLDRGQSVQYKASAANGEMSGHDVTGTIITANKPIGVEGGAECANVPASAPYCDHLCEMMMPIDRWGTTYYTAPFINRKGGDAILVVAAEDNTTITRTSSTGVRTHAILNKFATYFQFDIDEASKWTSDKPFMLVQYINGTDYPDPGANNGIGDPSMVVIPATSQYQKEIVFVAPKPASQTQFKNYLNFIVHKNAVASTSVDGQRISGVYNQLALTGTEYMLFRGSDLKPGAHIITSDSAVGLYLYGYGSYDSYAWPGSIGNFTTSSSDTVAPNIAVAEQCYSAQIFVSDSGSPALGQLMHSVDTTINSRIGSVLYSGANREYATYAFSVIDSSKSALARLSLVDGAGNRRTVTHTYSPDLPVMPAGMIVVQTPVDSQAQLAVPITSGSRTGLHNISTRLKQGVAFTLVSSPLDLNAGLTDTIRINYLQSSTHFVRDTLVVTADCWRQEIALLGSPVPFGDIGITDSVLDFGTVALSFARTLKDSVYNAGTESFTIDSIVLEASDEFTLLTGTLPQVVSAGDSVEFKVIFEPKDDSNEEGSVLIYTSIGMRTVPLTAKGEKPLSVNRATTSTSVTLYPNPAADLLTVAIDRASLTSSASIRILDLNGIEQLKSVAHGVAPCEIDISRLAQGSYIAEILLGGEYIIRKFTVVR